VRPEDHNKFHSWIVRRLFQAFLRVSNTYHRSISFSCTNKWKYLSVSTFLCNDLRVGIGCGVLERQTVLYLYVTLLAVCVRILWQTIICCILLAAKGAVSGAFASYPHPGGQGLAEP